MNGSTTLTPAQAGMLHTIGPRFEDGLTSEEAMRQGGLDWEVGKRPIYRADGSIISSRAQIIRLDTGDELGLAGADYGLLQNKEAFSALDQLAKDGIIRYESAWSTDNGRQIVLLARLPFSFKALEGDEVVAYALLHTRHDAGGGLHLLTTSERVRCLNAWRLVPRKAGLGNRVEASQFTDEGVAFRLRHSSNVKDRLAQAVSLVERISRQFAQQGEQVRELVSCSLKEFEFEGFLDQVLPLPEPRKANGNENPGFEKAMGVRSQVTALYKHGPLNNLPGMSGSAWAAFNAVTEYVDHWADLGRGETDRAKAESAFKVRAFGGGAQTKDRAWQAARALVS